MLQTIRFCRILLFILHIKICNCYISHYWEILKGRQEIRATYMLFNLTSDIIKDTDERIARIEYVRLDNFRTASYEIGFLNYLIVEEYRKMVDKYNTTLNMAGYMFPIESILCLQEIEAHYWQVEHLVNMQHEIERKYRIKTDLKGKAMDFELTEATEDPALRKKTRHTRDKETKTLEKMLEILAGTTKKKSTRWWWPIEYGWEIEKFW